MALQTPPLAMYLSSVDSPETQSLTSGNWNAFAGLPDDSLPEVPPHGVVSLAFSAPVALPALQAMLQIVPVGKHLVSFLQAAVLRTLCAFEVTLVCDRHRPAAAVLPPQ